jgi:predicted GIY-YIG superfamily endonuclease
MNTGYIYKLSAPDCPYVYIGSTKNITKRFGQHRSNPTRSSKYLMCYLGVKLDILESLEYDDVNELKKLERHHIMNNNSVNLQIPTRTSKEYYQDKIVEIKERQNTIEVCSKCGKSYTKRNKARHYKIYCKPIVNELIL